ncbi:hypothetical protein JCM10908_000018 [Rhodotorula pacifica]|uniref:zinc finger MYND domain-containing protein n=1 Tax=Rhodotorula pacifica TaxID=1495444 RepID=UPI00317D24C4
MNSPASTSDCCVCGAESTLKCSACARAGIDLFFCSKEHQKLVWFAHKPVCGPDKADFDTLPAMSKAELDVCKCPQFHQALANPSKSTFYELDVYTVASVGEKSNKLEPGSFAKIAPYIQEWLNTRPPLQRDCIRSSFGDVLGQFARKPSSPIDVLTLPAHTLAISLELWLNAHVDDETQYLERVHLLHRATIWAGLVHPVAGRAPDPKGAITPDLVWNALKRILQQIEKHEVLEPMITCGPLVAMFGYMVAAAPSMRRHALIGITDPANPKRIKFDYQV